MSTEESSVIHLPDSTAKNPYQENLVSTLSQQGVNADLIGQSSSYLLSIIRSSRRSNSDIVHLHWLCPLYRGANPVETIVKSILLPIELILTQILGISIVWTVHNIQPHEVQYPRLYALLSHIMGRISDQIIVHGNSAAEEVMTSYRLPDKCRDKIHVIPHGNYIGNYPNSVDQKEAREELGIDQNVTLYLFFGTLRSNKGTDTLIESFKEIDDSDARLLIVGEAKTKAYKERIDTLVSSDSRVQFSSGFVPDERLQYYFNAANAVVLPFSDVLTSGSAILSLSFGCPTILPDLGCVGELERGTVIYNPERGETVLDGLHYAQEMNLSELRSEAIAQAHELNWDSIAKQTENVYSIV